MSLYERLETLRRRNELHELHESAEDGDGSTTKMLFPDPVPAKTLAELLLEDRHPPLNSALVRSRAITMAVDRNEMESQLQQKLIRDEYCAHYLPQTCEYMLRLIDTAQRNPDIDMAAIRITDTDTWPAEFQACMVVLWWTNCSVYFVKFLRSDSPAKIALPVFLITYIILYSKQPDPVPDYASTLTSFLNELLVLLTKHHDEIERLGGDGPAELMPILYRWRDTGIVGKDVISLSQLMLTGGKLAVDTAPTLRRRFLHTWEWNKCSLPTCKARGVQLLKCSRCEAARYVGKAHNAFG